MTTGILFKSSCLLVLVLSQTGLAQKALKESGLDLTQQYLLLSTSKTSTMQRELDEAALAGYRVLAGCRSSGGELSFLLEKAAGGSSRYSYRLLATQLTSTMQKELAEAAAQGFRLVPRSLTGGDTEIVLVMEKSPEPASPAQYTLLATELTGSLQKELSLAAAQGFRVAAFVSRREHTVILEKGPPRSAEEQVKDHLLLATEKTSTMQKELEKAARSGHRLLAASPSSASEIMMILERAEQPRNYQYKLLAANRTSTLEKELNEAASQGFRLRRETVTGKRGTGGGWRSVVKGVGYGNLGTFGVVATVDEIVSVVEKPPDASERFHYLVLDTMRNDTMQREIRKAAEEGFEVAAMTGAPRSGGNPQLMGVAANLIVILEKRLRGKPVEITTR